MNKDILYSDSLVEIKNDSILFRRYSFFERDRMVLFSDIEKIVVKKATIWNGKFRFHGTGDFRTWFPKDFQRYKRDKIIYCFYPLQMVADRFYRGRFRHGCKITTK